MNLLSLSHELLLCIADSLDTHKDLNTLVRSNQRLNSLLHGRLYRTAKTRPLIWAARLGKVETARHSLRAGTDASARDEEFGTPLWVAANHGQEAIVKLLLEEANVDINGFGTSGDSITPLLAAAMGGHARVVRLLLSQQNININLGNGLGETPLFWAAFEGHVEVVKLLLQHHDIDVNVATGAGYTALMETATQVHAPVLRKKLSMGDEEDLDSDPWVAVYREQHRRYIEVFHLLLQRPEIDVNASSVNGEIVLPMAVTDGNEEIVRILLSSSKVDINCRGGRSHTPLMLATKSRQISLMKLLLASEDIDINARTETGSTAVFWAVGERYDEELLAVYLAHPAFDPNFPLDRNGSTPLIVAAKFGRERQVEMLLADPRVDLNATDNLGLTALRQAARELCKPVVKALLEKGADSHGVDFEL